MALSPRTLDSLVPYWTNRLGVDEDAFARSKATVGSTNEGGVQLFQRGEALVVGAPESCIAEVSERVGEDEPPDLTDEDALRRWFDTFGTVTAVLGPTFYGYADEESFTPVASDAQLLTEHDAPAYERLGNAVPDEEWANGGPEFAPGRVVGLFDGDELVATAGYDVWDDSLAHIAVVVHPNHRGEGYGRSVVSRVSEQALSEGLLPQYRTSDTWPWSVALAEGLGFERFATAALVCLA